MPQTAEAQISAPLALASEKLATNLDSYSLRLQGLTAQLAINEANLNLWQARTDGYAGQRSIAAVNDELSRVTESSEGVTRKLVVAAAVADYWRNFGTDRAKAILAQRLASYVAGDFDASDYRKMDALGLKGKPSQNILEYWSAVKVPQLIKAAQFDLSEETRQSRSEFYLALRIADYEGSALRHGTPESLLLGSVTTSFDAPAGKKRAIEHPTGELKLSTYTRERLSDNNTVNSPGNEPQKSGFMHYMPWIGAGAAAGGLGWLQFTRPTGLAGWYKTVIEPLGGPLTKFGKPPLVVGLFALGADQALKARSVDFDKDLVRIAWPAVLDKYQKRIQSRADELAASLNSFTVNRAEAVSKTDVLDSEKRKVIKILGSDEDVAEIQSRLTRRAGDFIGNLPQMISQTHDEINLAQAAGKAQKVRELGSSLRVLEAGSKRNGETSGFMIGIAVGEREKANPFRHTPPPTLVPDKKK